MTEVKIKIWDGDKFVPLASAVELELIMFSDIDNAIFANYPMVEIIRHTGLKDKNGKEIYEGDYVKLTGVTYNEYDYEGVIEFDNGTFKVKSIEDNRGYIRFWNDGCHDHESIEIVWTQSEAEIIGNIYENPELLKEQS